AGDRAHPRVRWSRLLLAGASAVVVVTPCYERAGSALVHSWLELVAPDLTGVLQVVGLGAFRAQDRKSTRLNSSHVKISYAVFCHILHPYRHSFPTRRSSDLAGDRAHPRVRWSRLLLAGASAVVVVTPCYERAGSALVHSWLELVAPDLTGVLQVVGLGAFRA